MKMITRINTCFYNESRSTRGTRTSSKSMESDGFTSWRWSGCFSRGLPYARYSSSAWQSDVTGRAVKNEDEAHKYVVDFYYAGAEIA